MSNLSNIEFVALDISGKNYLSWVLDAEIHLDSMGLGDTIKQGNAASLKDRAKAMIFLRRHLHEGLKSEYLTLKDPADLWRSLKDRYDHQKTVILPKARYDWMHLRLQDFKSISDYNSAMYRITSQLQLCGETVTDRDMLEKTFSTFHASNVLLQQQYREKGFTKYSELLSCLLVAEQNNELLMKNHEARPVGSAPFPEANATNYNPGSGKDRGSNKKHGRGRKKGRFHDTPHSSNKNKSHQKWDPKEEKKNGQSKNSENKCHRCGMKGHWSRACRMPRHLVDLYQASLKENGKKMEANFVSDNNLDDHAMVNMSHFDVSDFFENPDGNIGHLINDGNI